MSLLESRLVFKPLAYPWCLAAWEHQQQIHWLPSEVPMADDVKDWARILSDGERNLLTQIFRFFTQSDVEVASCYHQHYLKVFKPTEVIAMLLGFANTEVIHITAYSHLLDTIGMPEIEYQAFLNYSAMLAKHDYLQSFNVNSHRDIAKTLAVFGAFTEGMQLFASFAILLNFPRFGKMKGMGQIIAWSVRDESHHCDCIIRLFHTFVRENPQIMDESLRREILGICGEMVDHEDAFIDLAFEQGSVEGLSAEEVKRYIRFVANRRLTQLGLPEKYEIKKNPLPWLDDMLNSVEHANFFETRATEYSRAATVGTWDEAFA